MPRNRRTVGGSAASICSFCGTRNPLAGVTVPIEGRIAPISPRNSVDFPEPFGPTIVTISRRSMVRSTSLRTVFPPWDRDMLVAVISYIRRRPDSFGTGLRPRPLCARSGSQRPVRQRLTGLRLGSRQLPQPRDTCDK
jgi:hypothetical protein